MTTVEIFHRALVRAAIPILGVSIGRVSARATWRITYAADASAAQRTAGESLRLSFDPNDAAIVAAGRDQEAQRIDTDRALQAIAQLDFEERQKLQVRNGQTLRTAAECRVRLRAIYRSLLDA